MLNVEECARGMGHIATHRRQRKLLPRRRRLLLQRRRNNAAAKDARIYLGKEECALSMGQRSMPTYAVPKDAQLLLGREECALSMGQRERYAPLMGVPKTL